MDSSYILKIALVKFAIRLDVKCEIKKRVKKNTKVFNLSN